MFNQFPQGSTLRPALLGIPLVALAFTGPTFASEADLDGNGVIDAADQSVLLASWGDCPAPCPSDLNGDGVVDGIDFAILLDAASAGQTETGGSSDTVDSDGLYEDGEGAGATEDNDLFGSQEPTSPNGDGGDLNIPIHAVPLPAPVWIGIAGLAGAMVVRRRLLGRLA